MRKKSADTIQTKEKISTQENTHGKFELQSITNVQHYSFGHADIKPNIESIKLIKEYSLETYESHLKKALYSNAGPYLDRDLIKSEADKFRRYINHK